MISTTLSVLVLSAAQIQACILPPGHLEYAFRKTYSRKIVDTGLVLRTVSISQNSTFQRQ